MIKYNYTYGFCTLLHYNGLWPVKYTGNFGCFKKVEMVCTCGDGKCKNGCQVFEDAVEIIPVDKEWLLKDKLMGT